MTVRLSSIFKDEKHLSTPCLPSDFKIQDWEYILDKYNIRYLLCLVDTPFSAVLRSIHLMNATNFHSISFSIVPL